MAWQLLVLELLFVTNYLLSWRLSMVQAYVEGGIYMPTV